MASCRSCGAEIRWERTAAGKAIPLDFEPVLDGNLAFRNDGLVVSAAGCPPGPRYVAHFATCPHADAHRR